MADLIKTLHDLLQSGLPIHPHSKFDEQLEQLTEQAITARERKKQQDDELLQEAAVYLGNLEAEIETVEDQARRLTALQAEFDALGPHGSDGARSTRDLMAGLKEHRECLRRTLEEPSLQKAKERCREWKQEKVEQIRGVLESELTHIGLEDIVSDLLQLAGGDDWAMSVELMEQLEQKIRGSLGVEKLAPVQRFWNQMRKRTVDPELRSHARARARSIREELSEWEEASTASSEVGTLCEEIQIGAKYIDRLGSEEQVVQMHIWLGKMRRYQDEFELDQDSENRLFMAFGAVNRVRKELHPGVFFRELDRTFNSDWKKHVDDWLAKLEDARLKDKMTGRAKVEREAREAEQVRKLEELEQEKAVRLRSVLEALEGPIEEAEARDVLEVGVDSGGCQSDEFLKLARPYSRLAYGNPFRGLRRSLKRIGVPESELGTAEPPSVDPYQEAYGRLRKHYEGKKVLVIGGFPVESRRRQLEEGLGLSDLRWYEHYRETTEHRKAEAAIRSSGYSLAIFLVRFSSHKVNALFDLCRQVNIPATRIDRGCGVAALLRAFESGAVKHGV